MRTEGVKKGAVGCCKAGRPKFLELDLGSDSRSEAPGLDVYQSSCLMLKLGAQ